MSSRLPLLLACLLLLAGCIDRETADRTLVRGCASGVKAFINDPERELEIIGPENIETGPSDLGKEYREVSLLFILDDGWFKEEKPAKCTFIESFGAIGMSHKAEMHLVEIGDFLIGKKDGVIHGDMKQHVDMTNAIKDGMRGGN